MVSNEKCALKIMSAVCLWLATSSAYGVVGILPRLNEGQSLAISAIGTSETAMSPWFGIMRDWLNSKYAGKVTFDNEAISGSNSTSGIGTQLPAALTHNPDAIFIEFAINDSSNMTLEQSKANLQSMIDTIHTWAASKSKSVDIVIQTTNNDPYSGARPQLASYYQGYRDVARTNGLLLIDNYPNWLNLYNTDPTTWNNYVPDGVHPNSLGVYYVILPAIQGALLSQVPEPSACVLLTTAGLVASMAAMMRRRKIAMTEEACSDPLQNRHVGGCMVRKHPPSNLVEYKERKTDLRHGTTTPKRFTKIL